MPERMCTLTRRTADGGYEVFFNRDERRTRRPALPPAEHRCGPVRYLAPVDADAGGTWLAVTENGTTLALENGRLQPAPEPPGGWRSRGSLIPWLADAPTPDEVLARLGSCDLSAFRPFLLAAFGPDGTNRVVAWRDGVLAELEPVGADPLVSSSFDESGVREARIETFRELRGRAGSGGAEHHLAFHASHEPERGPRSPCMHRPEARTVSFSRVSVDPERVRFHYTGHSPCRGLDPAPPLALPRRRFSPDRVGGQ